MREGAAWAVWGVNGPSDTPKHPATRGHTNHHPRQRAIGGDLGGLLECCWKVCQISCF